MSQGQLQKAIRELPWLPIWMFTEPINKKPDEKKAGRSGRMDEDKQKICDALAETLKLTRNHCDLKYLTYATSELTGAEFVTAYWSHYSRTVEVTADSGTALIRDIMKMFD